MLFRLSSSSRSNAAIWEIKTMVVNTATANRARVLFDRSRVSTGIRQGARRVICQVSETLV